jgi:hypothetical protein
MLEDIMYESLITLQDMPVQWIPKIELYYPDLPQFPIQYVHVLFEKERIYGFPAFVNFRISGKPHFCEADFHFLSNKDLDKNETAKDVIRNELANRVGLSDKIGLNDVKEACNGRKEYELFFDSLWKYLSKAYGSFLPYGQLYEEVYSIVRFVSAWQPKTGKQSEMRMLYNFLSNFGKRVKILEKWDHLESYILPTYDDIMSGNLNDFPRFKELKRSIGKLFDLYFTEVSEINGKELRYMKKSWPIKKFRKITSTLVANGKIEIEDKGRLDLLVDAFNRHPWRAAYFIWSICNIDKTNDYRKWTKDDFIKFYSATTGKGCSQKAVACFLQQGFKNDEVLPVDTWVESFQLHPLGIEDKEAFFKTFKKIGKLERAIWLASQAKKTNIKLFFYTLWCTRYGTSGGGILRGANPLSCYECQLLDSCPGHKKIANKYVYVKKPAEPMPSAFRFDADFVVEIDSNHVPKKVFKNYGRWELVDEFSGYILHTQRSNEIGKNVKITDFIKDLPPMDWLARQDVGD